MCTLSGCPTASASGLGAGELTQVWPWRDGEEGMFFVWTVDEIRTILGDQAEAFIKAYGVQPLDWFADESHIQRWFRPVCKTL